MQPLGNLVRLNIVMCVSPPPTPPTGGEKEKLFLKTVSLHTIRCLGWAFMQTQKPYYKVVLVLCKVVVSSSCY